VQRLLQRLAPVAKPGCCPVCTQPLPETTRRPRTFCTTRCRDRAMVLRRRGLLPGGPHPLLPAPRKQRLDLPDDMEIVGLTASTCGRAGEAVDPSAGGPPAAGTSLDPSVRLLEGG
jgi:hypothetical protein